MFEKLKKRLQLKKIRGLEYKGPKKISLKREAEVFEMIDKILDSTESYRFDAMEEKNGWGSAKNDKYKKVLEDKICKMVEENPELKYCKFFNIRNCDIGKYFLGHHAINCAFDKLALMIAEDDYAIRLQYDYLRYPMPHFALYEGRYDVVKAMLNRSDIHEILNDYNENIGHEIAKDKHDVKLYLDALKNEKLRTAKNHRGKTMGLLCADSSRIKDYEVASIFTFLAYPDQREVVDNGGNNMLMTMAKANNQELGNLFKHPEILTPEMVNIVNDKGESFVDLADIMNKNATNKGYVPIVIPQNLLESQEERMRKKVDNFFDKEA
ncbi:MAG: hypothetical protein IJA61_03075 [Clostridia bacterium]|nr:hypothetical protein [Clostridia bacterium]